MTLSSLPLVSTVNPLALGFESKLIAGPYAVELWLEYVASTDEVIQKLTEATQTSKKNLPQNLKNLSELKTNKYVLYERAVRLLPGSYKIWYQYLTDLLNEYKSIEAQGGGLFYSRSVPSDPSTITVSYNYIISAFERALIRMSKMPRIWEMYLKFVSGHKTKITDSRKAFDKALQSLPATQHSKIWPLYINFALNCSVPETAIRVQRRHITFSPASKEEFANYLASHNRWSEAASLISSCVDSDDFVSPLGTTQHELWMKLCDICSKHPTETKKSVDFDAVIRAALDKSSKRYTDKFSEIAGVLWCKLAEYYTRSGDFDQARNVYEEGIVHVERVKDFSVIFDSYSRFEENTLTAKIAMQEEGEEDDTDDDDDDAEKNDNLPEALKELLEGGGKEGNDIELSLARAEYLVQRRPLLLNAVLLRQNPHNVGEWHNRADMYMKMEGDAGGVQMASQTLEEGCKAVDSAKAVNGFPSSLWIALAKLYEESGALEDARGVFARVCTDRCYSFKHIEDLAECYCAWVEMELRQEDFDGAMNAAREGVATPADYSMSGQQRAGGNKMKGGRHQSGLYRNVKLWNLYLDLEESLGSFDTAKAAYLKCMELGVATSQIVLNFADFLTEAKYFEEAFAAYEKGLALFYFPQPQAKPIWAAYLEKFHARYGGTKVERSRDLYERCLEKCPPEMAAEFFMPYAKLEEEFGLAKRALAVYERNAVTVPEEEKLQAYMLYIAKTQSFYGATKARPIYEAGIAACNDADAAKLCLQYSDLEKSLGEMDRARASLKYGAQLCDPSRDPVYWTKWHDFEVSYGNEETFRDMLRIKRSVQAAFSTVNYNADQGTLDSSNMTEAEAMAMIGREEGFDDEANAANRMSGFVASSAGGGAGGNDKKRKADMVTGGNAIENLERQAQKIKETIDAGQEEEGGGGDEDIDLDDL
ncbi:hypothetical protein TrST_g10493 [Triparma strigata]|uniref:Uncharacterized protein n=1 Tax=Triparma strigata TaxID=1606541 RepID=A0A9W7B797_9STRA|nr:hypothetical protein TrST_g10493 [Triparma strigata]